MPEQQEKGLLKDEKDNFGLLYFGLSVYAWALLPFLRRGVGRNGMGLAGPVAMVVILWYAGVKQSQEMITYFWCWILMVAWCRLTPGRGVVSAYQGWPYLTGWLAGDEMLARVLEAVLVWVAGNVLRGWSMPVGQFVTYGGYALGFKVWIEWMYIARQDQAMEDAVLEMEARMRRARMRR